MADVLFLSAHPDDAEFGAGGTLLKLAKKYNVASVILTHGEAGTHGSPEIREKEAKAAADYGNYEVEFSDFKDNFVEDNVESAMKLALIIRKHKPKVIFAPYHTNMQNKSGAAHPDHSATGRLARKAARFAKFKNAKLDGKAHQTEKIIYYMVPRYQKPSFVVDVSDVIEELKKLWERHASQLAIADNKVSERLLLWRRAIGLASGLEYAEEFIMEEPLQLQFEEIFNI